MKFNKYIKCFIILLFILSFVAALTGHFTNSKYSGEINIVFGLICFIIASYSFLKTCRKNRNNEDK